ENAIRNHIDHDFIVVHDPQPLPLIRHYTKKKPWIWRCHLDMSDPHKELFNYLKDFVEMYDSVIYSIDEYHQGLETPELTFMPAIDPFSIKCRELTEEEMQDRFDHYDIPTDLPLVVQISRFDKWKDPEGVIKAFKKARKEVDATLVLLGNVATDDPEGEQVYESLLEQQEDRIIILSKEDTALVNSLQKKARVVLQKSIREGFGLTVSEALWKGTPVIGGNVGGIRYQIEDGQNGYLVNSVDEAAERMITLLKDEDKCRMMGKKGMAIVRKNFLMIRLLEQYLDLFNSFDIKFTLDREGMLKK
ncbi:MAG: glycosyltransferase, partial [Candidatus Kapaibacterium sp.]